MGFLQPRSNFAVWNAYNWLKKILKEYMFFFTSIKVGYRVAITADNLRYILELVLKKFLINNQDIPLNP